MTAASDELALPTVGEFLSAVGVTATVVYPEHPGSPVVALDIPYDWHEVIREVLPTAFGAWALPAEADAPPQEAGWVDNAVLMVWRMSRPVDPMAVMRCAFTDSRRLPDWHEHRTRSEDRDGFPSAAISGTYSFGELSLWASTRYLMAGTPTGQYLVQLTVTTRAEDDRDGRFIAGSLEVHSPTMPPPSHARQPEPPVADVQPESGTGAGPSASAVRSTAELQPETPASATESTGAHAWSESAAGTRSESSSAGWVPTGLASELPVPATESAGTHAWSASPGAGAHSESPADVRSGQLGVVPESVGAHAWSEPEVAADPRSELPLMAAESAGAHAWSESLNSPRPAAVGWSESAVGTRSESSASAVWSPAELPDVATETTGVHAWMKSPDSGVRSEPVGGLMRSDSLAAVVRAELFDEGGVPAPSSGEWLEPTDLTGRSGAAALAESDSAGRSASGLRPELYGLATESVGAHAWVESPEVDERDEFRGGGVGFDSLVADVQCEGGGVEGWSEAEAAEAWLESRGLARRFRGGAAGRGAASEAVGQVERSVTARSEVPGTVGRVESAVLAWSEAPELGGEGAMPAGVGRPEAAAGEWAERGDGGWTGEPDGELAREQVGGREWVGAQDGGWIEDRAGGRAGGREWVGESGAEWAEERVGSREWIEDRAGERAGGRERRGEPGGEWAGERDRELAVGREWVGQGDGEWIEDADGQWGGERDRELVGGTEWVEDAGGEWVEDAEEEWDEDSDGEWEDVEDEWEELEEVEVVPWSEAPSVVVRAESVAGGAQSEPPPAVRDALLPVLGESGPEPEAGQAVNVGFHI